jgi:kinetochore protein Spc25
MGMANARVFVEDQRMKKRDIEILTLKSSTHAQNLAKESAETAEMHDAIASLTLQRDERLGNRDTLKAQIAEVQKAVSARREAQLKHRRYLDGQARHNEPELDFWENYLSMRIDGAGVQDRIKFVFNNISEREWEREAWFEIDTSEREVKVIHYRPKVEQEEIERVQEQYNETRELGTLLKGMREIFIDALK